MNCFAGINIAGLDFIIQQAYVVLSTKRIFTQTQDSFKFCNTPIAKNCSLFFNIMQSTAAYCLLSRDGFTRLKPLSFDTFYA
jgi:hypothetical protein